MEDKSSTVLAVITLSLLAALAVFLSIQAHSAWVGILIFAGLLALFFAMASAQNDEVPAFFAGSLLGLGALIAAVWIGHLAGRFWWTPLWIFLSLLFFVGGRSLSENLDRGSAAFAYVVSILALLFAVLGPWLLYGVLAKTVETAAPAAPVAAAAVRGNLFSGMWRFISAMFGSWWSILYLVLALLLGRFWAGRWGWLILPLALVLAAGVLEWLKPGGSQAYVNFFRGTPFEHVSAALRFSIERFGTAAWGAVLLGAGLAVLLLPVHMHIFRSSSAVTRAGEVRQVFGTTAAARVLRSSGTVSGLYSLASLLNLLTLAGMFILVWTALMRLAQAQGALPFNLPGIADLALPRWKPLFQWPYLLNGFAVGLVGFLFAETQRRLRIVTNSAFISVLTLLGSLLMSIFIPAGCVLFLGGQTLGLIPSALASLIGRSRERAAEPARRQPAAPAPQVDQADAREYREALERMMREIADRQEKEAAEQVVKQAPAPQYTYEPALSGDLLLEHRIGIFNLIRAKPDGYAMVDNDYCVYHLEEMGGWQWHQIADLSQEKVQGLIPLAGGRIGAVGLLDRVILLGQPNEEIQASFAIFHWAVNSFGTILAISNTQYDCVKALILGAKKEQTLVEGIHHPNALAFSADNRFLAVGTLEGSISILDMATRQIIRTLTVDTPGSVEHIQSTLTGGWTAAFDNDQLAAWDQDGELLWLIDTDDHVFCLDVDPATGEIATGDASGTVSVYDPEDGGILFGETAHEDEIVAVLFEAGKGSLISAGGDGTLRRVRYK